MLCGRLEVVFESKQYKDLTYFGNEVVEDIKSLCSCDFWCCVKPLNVHSFPLRDRNVRVSVIK